MKPEGSFMQPTTTSPRTTYWQPVRLAALFSLFSLFAIYGEPAFWLFLMFLMFLIPIPAKSRSQP
jgi:hypothetical protein